MGNHKSKFLSFAALGSILLLLLAGCGGGGGDGDVPVDTSGIEAVPQEAATLSAGDVGGKLFVGEVDPPQAGSVGLYIRTDNTVEMIIATDDPALSLHMNGILEGQRVSLTSEVGAVRALGRVENGQIQFSITIPGHGFFRTTVTEAAEGAALYQGEMNDLTGGLVVLPDGSVKGFAPIEEGEEPVYEALCADIVEGLPDTLTAKTCDSGQEIELTRVQG
jgi:hypothetical protein